MALHALRVFVRLKHHEHANIRSRKISEKKKMKNINRRQVLRKRKKNDMVKTFTFQNSSNSWYHVRGQTH